MCPFKFSGTISILVFFKASLMLLLHCILVQLPELGTGENSFKIIVQFVISCLFLLCKVHVYPVGAITAFSFLFRPTEPHNKKTCLWDFRPGPTQIVQLYSHKRWLEA